MFDCYDIKKCKECHCEVKSRLLYGLNEVEKEVLYKDRCEVEFNTGETIFKQNTTLTHVACIKEGYVKMSTEANHNKNFLMRIIQPGEIVGGMGLYVDEVHHATCSAITPVKLCLISLNSFKNTLEVSNRFAIDLIKKLNGHAIQSKRQAVDLTSKSMYSRVADMLLYLSQTIYKDVSFTTTLKRQDLADFCALTKESTIRILKEFKDSNIIAINNNSFQILNVQELKKISRFN